MEQRTRVTNSFQVGLIGGLGVLTAIIIGAAISQTATPTSVSRCSSPSAWTLSFVP